MERKKYSKLRTSMNELQQFFYSKSHRRIHKFKHYFAIYQRHFERFRFKQVNILEIGAAHGGSIDMWQDYFGPDCTVYTIDIDTQCRKFENKRTRVYTGNQEDPNFLRYMAITLPVMDIIIDDGSHTMKGQRLSFEYLFPKLNSHGGVYLIEDVHTSFIKYFRWKWHASFLSYTKKLIDKMYFWGQKKEDYYTKHISAIHFYHQIVVIEKEIMEKPSDIAIGEKTIEGNSINGIIN